MDAAQKEAQLAAGQQNSWLVCQETLSNLLELGAVLEGSIDSSDPELRQIALSLVRRGGKRLRPALLFVVARFGDPEEHRLLTAAAAIELFHIASLYHDDVMDRAPARRGAASVNVGWGNLLATVGGTYLFARATALLASLGDIPNQLASQASADLCTGQLQEVENAYNLDLSEAEHLNILDRKTGTLFELPCRLGAYLGGLSSAHTAAVATYGHHLGLAFQLSDDALDLTGEPGEMGKVTGTDLREGIYSLPVLRALQSGTVGEQLRTMLMQVQLTEEKVHKALDLIRASTGIAETLEAARRSVRQAQDTLAALPDCPARLSLSNLAEYVITRSS